MIGIMVIAQSDIAVHLVESAERMMSRQPGFMGINLGPDRSIEDLTLDLSRIIREKLGQHEEGVLILTDLFGGTPTNACLAEVQKSQDPAEILTGVNLPMVLSALANRGHMKLKELAAKVMADGQKGIKNAKSVKSE